MSCVACVFITLFHPFPGFFLVHRFDAHAPWGKFPGWFAQGSEVEATCATAAALEAYAAYAWSVASYGLSSGQLANQETMPDFLSNSKGFGPQFITWTSAILVENRIVFWHFLTINFHYAIDTGHQWLLSAINGHQHGHQQAISSQVFSPNLLLCSQALEDPRPERPLPAMPEVGQLGDSRVTQGWSMQYY